MRILIGGFVAFVVWTIFSAWMYKDNLYPVFNPPAPAEIPVTVAPVTEAPAPEPAPESLSIYFEYDKAAFKSDQQTDSRIAEYKNWLEKNPSAKLTIKGHTDASGGEQYNMDLGRKRAEAAGKHIISLGIPSEKVVVTSSGESEPAADNSTEDGRIKNRRSEIIIKNE